jgi:hypothetical protein
MTTKERIRLLELLLDFYVMGDKLSEPVKNLIEVKLRETLNLL